MLIVVVVVVVFHYRQSCRYLQPPSLLFSIQNSYNHGRLHQYGGVQNY